MLRATALPLFRLVLVYISGALLAICYPIDLFTTLILVGALSLLYLGGCMQSSARAFAWLNPIGLLLIFGIGYSNLLLHIAQQRQLPKWVTCNHHLKGYIASIQKVYHPLRCNALITHIKDDSGWHKNNTSIQLYLSKKCNYKPTPGDTLLICGTPVRILPSKSIHPANLFSFLRQPSLHRHGLKQSDHDFILFTAQPFPQSKKWHARIRQWCSQTLQKKLKDQQVMTLVATLLWGAKETLCPTLRKAYADTGTIHVLAISGLHVGMFYLLIKNVLRFMLSKIGFLILSEPFTLLGLWLYAGICHFAPPILRATIMITMARLGFLIGRGSNRYNGWLAAAFALLLWDPFVLFNCGFQLSYLATLGILYLQPYIHRLITPENYWLQKIWTATTLSIAAQISTFPLIVYYFKQFPTYFIIANWLVVPAIFGMLVLSLALLVGSHLPIMGTLLGCILEKLVFATNAFVCWVAKWPMGTLSFCFVNGRSVCLLYIVLLAICLFLQNKNLMYPVIINLCTIFYSVNQIKIIIAQQKQCKMICCNNDQLSFTLKDGIERLGGDSPPSYKGLLREYPGGIIASWHKKVVLTIHTLPPDWYGWCRAKLDADYLLIDEKLLYDIPTIVKVCHVKSLVIYSKQPHPWYHHPMIKKSGIEVIWLRPGAKKCFSWPKIYL